MLLETPTRPSTYNQVLDAYPDMHPELREHVARLALAQGEPLPQPDELLVQSPDNPDGAAASLPKQPFTPAPPESSPPTAEDVDIEKFKHALVRAQSSIIGRTVPPRFTPEVKAVANEAFDAIDATQDPAERSRRMAFVLHTIKQLCEVPSRSRFHKGDKPEKTEELYGVALTTLLDRMETSPQLSEALKHVYEDFGQNRVSASLHEMILKVNGARSPSPNAPRDPVELKLLCKLYGTEDPVAMIARHTANDVTLRKLMRSPATATGMTNLMLGAEKQEWWEQKFAEGASDAKRQWADRFLRHIVGLPPTARRELLFASYVRVTGDAFDDMNVDGYKLLTLLQKTAENVRHLSIDDSGRIDPAVGHKKIQTLRKEAGIVNLDFYDSAQLELMHKVLQGDPKTLEHLRKGDVTVVFIDAVGDHNGALRQKSKLYATKTGRTLFFEVKEPTDYYRYMALLHYKGVDPSTVALCSHGGPGTAVMGRIDSYVGQQANGTDELHNQSRRFHITNSPYDIPGGEHVYLPDSETIIARIVSTFMRDSRAIDDPEAVKGKRRLILDICSQARRPTKRRESNAETLVRLANNPNLLVIGGADILSTAKTKHGIRFMKMSHNTKTNRYQTDDPLPATVFQLNEFGDISASTVDEVILRKDKVSL